MKRGRWSIRFGLGLAAALLAWPGDFAWQDAAAADGSVRALSKLANSENRVRSLDAIEKLRRLGTEESQKALVALAESDDTQHAVAALSAVGRSKDPGAQRALEAVLGNARRSDAARSVALTMWCRLRAREGASWQEIEAAVGAHAHGNAALADAAAAAKKSYFSGKAGK